VIREPSLMMQDATWRELVDSYWDKRPVVLRAPLEGDIPTVPELFETFRRASKAWIQRRHIDDDGFIRLYIEHELECASPEQRYFGSRIDPPYAHLPTDDDLDLDAYLARLAARVRGQRVGIIHNDCLASDWMGYLKIRSLVSGLFRALRGPVGLVQPVVFFGNYRYTPFGVHKDHQHVLTIVVRGPKRFRVWPLDAPPFRDRPEVPPHAADLPAFITFRDADDYERIMTSGEVLEAHTGDVMYWPASHWHVAEPSEGTAVTISIPFTRRVADCLPESHPYRRTGKALHVAARTFLHPPGDLGLPPALERFIRTSPMLADDRRELRATTMASWLRFVTASSCDPPPHPRPRITLLDRDVVAGTGDRPIVCARSGPTTAVIAANGHVSETVPDPRLFRLVDQLNSGQRHAVRALLHANSGELVHRGRLYVATRAQLRTLLTTLHAWRAIERVPAGSADSA
jgi:hypothetical protein